jgi:hypothetical protein
MQAEQLALPMIIAKALRKPGYEFSRGDDSLELREARQ